MDNTALKLMWIEHRWKKHADENTIQDYIPEILSIAQHNQKADIFFWIDEQQAKNNPSYTTFS